MKFFSTMFVDLLGVAKWVSDSFPTIRIVLISLLTLLAIAIIVIILMQQSNQQGMGAIAGQQSDTFFSKNKSKTMDGTLKKLTVIIGIVMVVLCILFFVSLVIYNPATATA